MKKNVITILLTLVTCIVSGQSIGLKAGFNLNDISTKGDIPAQFEQETKKSFGFHFGAFAEVEITSGLGFSPELQFSQRGYRFESDFIQEKVTTNVKLNYIELPVLFTYYPLEFLGLQVGPNISYLASANAVSDGNKSDWNDTYDIKLDLGISGGLKFSVFEDWLIYMRYYYGITKIDEVFISPEEPITEFNRSFQFGLGYKIKQF